MPDDTRSPHPPEKLPIDFARLQKQYQRILEDAAKRQMEDDGFRVADPELIGKAFMRAASQLMARPERLMEAQLDLFQSTMALWDRTAKRMLGEAVPPVALPDRDDRRFKDDDWEELIPFDFMKQAYLIGGRWLYNTMNDIDGLDTPTRRKVEFYTRQFIDAMSPTNFAATNPKVLKQTMESGGENLMKGLENLIEDLDRGKGELKISMTDEAAFEIGRNVATTPGKVVFQTDLMQLIQYTPSTETVSEIPLLIIPPWINKFYILDLREKNSLVKWATDQGMTVFIISWVNPDESLSNKGFEDYMLEGPIAALDAINEICGTKEANVVGYCLGGTLLACTLAYIAAKRKAARIRCATFFTALVDFREAGDLLVFIDDEQLERLDKHMSGRGFLEAKHMAQVFNMLRSNDLIWSFVVNNYLMGRDPFPFDLLYWNADSTRMPAMMHSFYLRNMYLENRLVEPGVVVMDNTPIDLQKVKQPIYMLATREDHIAPWRATYAGTQVYKSDVTFVLAASGHIAGVVNPPAANKYGYWVGEELPPSPEEWLEKATPREGSWWTHWLAWLEPNRGAQVPARAPGSAKHPPIEDAPGSYVKVRAKD